MPPFHISFIYDACWFKFNMFEFCTFTASLIDLCDSHCWRTFIHTYRIDTHWDRWPSLPIAFPVTSSWRRFSSNIVLNHSIVLALAMVDSPLDRAKNILLMVLVPLGFSLQNLLVFLSGYIPEVWRGLSEFQLCILGLPILIAHFI